MTMDQLAKRAVETLTAINPDSAVETMGALQNRCHRMQRVITWQQELNKLMWRHRDVAMAEAREARAALARERIECADLRRHLQTLQIELQKFEEHV